MRSGFLLACLFLLSGCVCQRDMRGSSDICEVHHVRMKVMYVRASVGPVEPAPGYAKAHDELFPHTIPSNYLESKLPWQRDVYYVCGRCIEAEKEWLQSHSNASIKDVEVNELTNLPVVPSPK